MPTPSFLQIYLVIVGITICYFLKSLTALSIFRIGLGLKGAGFGVVVVALSIILSLYSLDKELQDRGGISAIGGKGLNSAQEVVVALSPIIKKGYQNSKFKDTFNKYSLNSQEGGGDSVKSSMAKEVLVYLTDQLNIAFKLGLLFIIPFLLVDLIVSQVLVLLQIDNLEASIVSLPIKILIFLSIGGWEKVVVKLLAF